MNRELPVRLRADFDRISPHEEPAGRVGQRVDRFALQLQNRPDTRPIVVADRHANIVAAVGQIDQERCIRRRHEVPPERHVSRSTAVLAPGEDDQEYVRGELRIGKRSRDELYQIAQDPGEQKDLAAAQPERREALRKKLDAWLKETGARFPVKNPQYDPQRAARQREHIRTKQLPALERRHARYLSPDFEPNRTWWGSSPD